MPPRKRNNGKQKDGLWSFVKGYVNEYSKETSIHGISQIFHSKRHPSETLSWIAIFGLAICGCYYVIRSNIFHFQESPSVISLERDFRSWNTSFPSITICYENPLDVEAAEKLIMRKWRILPNSTSNGMFNYYMGFLSAVANASYTSLYSFSNYRNDTNLTNEELFPLAIQVSKKFTENIFIYSSNIKKPQRTLTELGLCFVISSAIAKHFNPDKLYSSSVKLSGSFRKSSNVNTADLDLEDAGISRLPVCNVLNSLCYCRVTKPSGKLIYYVHSAKELPIWGSKSFTVEVDQKRDTTFIATVTTALPNLRHLNPKQRKCLYQNEEDFNSDYEDEELPPRIALGITSYNLCKMNCRGKLAYILCGCTPHFWSNLYAPICKVEGLLCLLQFSDYLKNLEIPQNIQNEKKFQCSCLPQCEDIVYQLEKNIVIKSENPKRDNVGFRVAMEHFSRTRFSRQIIYSFDDLLVSLGGTAGLFLGCSLLSFAELVYFITVRFGINFIKQKKLRKIPREAKKIRNKKLKNERRKRKANSRVHPLPLTLE